MKKIFQILLICGLIPALSIPVSAAADPGKSEEGQAMIGPSRSDSKSSSGMDWGAAKMQHPRLQAMEILLLSLMPVIRDLL